jgi:hypothetical protein
MTVALLLLMAHGMMGQEAHEWIGAVMFTLVIIHNILNINWYKNLFKGKYTPFRVFQSVLDISVLLCIFGLMVSGVVMSRHVFAILPIDGGMAFARTLHMLSAYWGFALMSLHAGLHINMMMAAMRRTARVKERHTNRTILLRIMALLLCAYGIYVFIQRQIGSYMLLRTQFAFFDLNEPLPLFLLDYIAITGLFACAGHYIGAALRKISAKKSAAIDTSL